MSLVAYGSSEDESENEDVISNSIVPNKVSKKKWEPVKITIPSLQEFKEVNDLEPAKKPKSQGGCGLFSILPPPKNSSTFSKPGFTPYVFSKKKDTKTSSPQTTKPKIETTLMGKVTEFTEKTDSSIEPYSSIDNEPDDSSEKVDFFSLETTNSFDRSVSVSTNITIGGNSTTETSRLPSNPAISRNQHSSFTESKSINDYYAGTETPDVSVNKVNVYENDVPTSYWEVSYAETSTSSQQDIFKDKEFLRLTGKRKKEEIDIIDVNAADQLTGKDEWIMQSLTEEKVHRPSKRRHDMPTTQQKRKHQITYLAFQAKERELDLKNQWSLNSRTRRETQAKYGF